MNLTQLQSLADKVGVGYSELSKEELRQKLKFEAR
jgi:hypothetical protein